MKANQNIGRIELLQWINEFTECDYPKLELCCDGIGYCQVIDAIHPGIINLQKLSFSAKYPDDYMKNLKVLDEAFNKLEIEKVVPMDKLKLGKFQDNMRFLQWLYTYANRTGPVNLKNYKGYEKRLEAISKQRTKEPMNPYLVPNKAFLKFKSKKYSHVGEMETSNNTTNAAMVQNPAQMTNAMIANSNPVVIMNTLQPGMMNMQHYNNNTSLEDRFEPGENVGGLGVSVAPAGNMKLNKKIWQYEEYLKDLESDLKVKMEYNWKLMYAIEDMLYQRKTLYNLLVQIEGLAQKNQGSEFKETILNIITYTPNDFKQEEELK